MKRTHRLILLITFLLLTSGISFTQTITKPKAQSSAPQQAVTPAATGNPVTGSGTVGRIAKWTGVDGANSFTIGNTNIFEDKFGKVGIGTITPTSLLTVQGMIETTLGGYKFPDGTIQTTAGLASVFHNATLTGNGTQASPLGVAVPLDLSGAVPFFHPVGAIIRATNTADGGVAIRAVGGAAALIAEGSNSSSQTAGGTGVIGVGGSSSSSVGAEGISGFGGAATGANDGGIGVRAKGGVSLSPTGRGGDGLRAFGGNGSDDNLVGGVGVRAAGGGSNRENTNAAEGVITTGGEGIANRADGGAGISATGGNSSTGSGGDGVKAQGGKSNGRFGGAGVRAVGADKTTDQASAGDGVIAIGGKVIGNLNGVVSPGIGVVATGGSSDTGQPGTGVLAKGASSEIATGGTGLIALGGGSTANGAQGGVGIHAFAGQSSHGNSGEAGIFEGNVVISGNLNVSGTKNFKIDHPLDPENKYLVHAAIESSEILNVYSGNIKTNDQGEAIVTLPDWFEALNRDFRYQLTVIGTFAQAIVAEEISNNRFTIKTNTPGVKVSWQVTGIRTDASTRSNPFKVEEEKPQAERGTYLNPAAYNQPEERGIQWAINPEMMQQMKEARLKQLEESKQKAPNKDR